MSREDTKQARTLAFCHDARPELIWECDGFDRPWNGWASPIVDWETLIDILDDAEWRWRAEGAIFFTSSSEHSPGDEEVVLVPDDMALYRLRDLGWTFLEVKTHATKVLPFKRPDAQA